MVDSQVGGVVLQVLNFTCVLPCIALKVPQIWRILQTKSTKGVSITSVLLEWACFAVILVYQFANGYPIESYAEWILLNIQELILVMLVMFYQNFSIFKIFILGMIYMAYSISSALDVIPMWILAGMMSFITPCSASSKVLQIQKIISSQDSGSVSLMTWLASTYVAAGRVITTYIQTGDIPLIINYTVAALLNAGLVVCIIVYSPSKKKMQ
ncbi:solute carrier family 66 member 3-like [Ptychodera flava]|uniref:solute carrier family 66 member 3-like n=1 Tax=Ptychodera flava TaxID=63121 RepID=UPI003969E11F